MPPDRSTAQTAVRPSGLRRPAAVVVAIALSVLLAGCGSDSDDTVPGAEKSGSGPGERATAKAVSMQASDLPEGLVACRYSGDVETYLREVKARNPNTYESVLATQERFKAAGSTGGYIAYFATSDKTCETIFKPQGERDFTDADGHLTDHPSFAFSFVMQFPDAATAEAAYREGIFGQNRLQESVGEATMDVERGDSTGLGPNSVTSNTRTRPNHVRQAIWQSGPFNIYVGTDVIVRQDSERITASMNSRTG